DGLINRYYHELYAALPMEVEGGWRIIVTEETLANLKPVYDLLNIKYYLSTPSATPKELPGLRFVGMFDLGVYRSDSIWPRAFFTDTLSSYETPSKFVEMVKGGDGNPFAMVAQEDLTHSSVLTKFL